MGPAGVEADDDRRERLEDPHAAEELELNRVLSGFEYDEGEGAEILADRVPHRADKEAPPEAVQRFARASGRWSSRRMAQRGVAARSPSTMSLQSSRCR